MARNFLVEAEDDVFGFAGLFANENKHKSNHLEMHFIFKYTFFSRRLIAAFILWGYMAGIEAII